MKKVCILLFVILLSSTSSAQNDSLQAAVTELPLELRHEKSIRSHVFHIYIAIVYSRDKGELPFNLGQFYGKSLGLTWEPVKGKGLEAYTQWLTAYVTLFKDYKIEILKNDNHVFEFRVKQIGEEYIEYWSKKYKKEDWITVEEYFDFFQGFFVATSNYLGFEAESKENEGWLYLKILEQ